MTSGDPINWHGTTILTVRKGGRVVIAGDGQVSMGDTIMKGNARKVRPLGKGDVIAGFAGATADAMTLFERLEAKIEQYPGQLTRACVELAKDWRTDRFLRRLEALMIVADKEATLVLTGNGDVLEPESGIVGIGSAITRSPPPARLPTRSCRPKRLRARQWPSPPASASIPIIRSPSKASTAETCRRSSPSFSFSSFFPLFRSFLSHHDQFFAA